MCFRYRRLLIPYSEGELGTVAANKLERHLTSCARCRAELDCIRLVAGALCSTDAPAVEPSDDLWARISARIANEPVRIPSRQWFGHVRGLAAGAAAAVAVAAIGVRLLSPGAEPVVRTAKRNAVPSIKTPVLAKQPSRPVEIAKAAPTVAPWAIKKVTQKPIPAPSDNQWFAKRHSVAASTTKGAGKQVGVATLSSDYPHSSLKDKAFAGRAVAWDDTKNRVADGVAPAPAAAPPASTARRIEPASGEARGVGALAKTAGRSGVSLGISNRDMELSYGCADTTTITSTTSVVDDLNETEGVRTAAIFSYP